MNNSDGSALFIHVQAPLGVQADETVRLRWAHVVFNEAALFDEGGMGWRDQIVLNVFDDMVYTAVLERVESNPSGSYTWIGKIPEVDTGQAIFVVRNDEVVGNIFTPQASYEIRPIENGHHLIAEVNEDNLLLDENDFVIPEEDNVPKTGETTNNSPMSADDGSIIDIMVAYSDDAADATILSEIELAVAYTNQTYINSQINQRLFLVHAGEVNYVETGDLNLDLDAVTFNNVTNVHAWRDTFHADDVMFIVENDGAGGGCAGLAWVQTSVNPSFQSHAFASMGSCLTYGVGIFAHEFGHNMGANHDWFVNTNLNPYTYAHGYVNTTERWRTIMAYNSHCSALGFSCSSVPYWSNPNVLYNGAPMGVPAGTGTGCTTSNTGNPPCDADVHLALNNTAANTSGFRVSRITWTGNSSTDWNDANNWTMEEGVPGSTTTVNRVPRYIDDVLIPTSPAGGNFPTLSGNMEARDVEIATGATMTMSNGTLTVYGNWEEQGNGRFLGNDGTVILRNPLDKAQITTNGSSYFNHLQIGDGIGTSAFTLNSDLDVNGNFTLETGITFDAGNHTLTIGGDWSDEGASFAYDTSRVVFDGTAQTIDKVTTTTILSEDFNQYTTCGCTSSAPTGWSTDGDGNRFLFGKLSSAPDGSAVHWDNSSDGWLITPDMALQSGVTYNLSFNYLNYFNNGDMDLAVYYGTEANSTAMLAGTQIGTIDNVTNTSYQTANMQFTVGADDTYYVGINSLKSTVGFVYGLIDDVIITATSYPTFYDMEVSSSQHTQLAKDIIVQHDLTVNSGGVMDLSTNDVTVEGAVVNNGRIRQAKDTPTSTTTEFLHITDSAGTTDKYYGVDITPSGNMMTTTVQIAGNQTSCTNDPADQLITRCFDISPDTAQSATIRFWFTEAERDGQDASTLIVWHWDDGMHLWNEASSTSTYAQSEGGAFCSSGGGLTCYVEAVAVTTYSPFVPGSGLSTPTAVSVRQIRATQTHVPVIWLSAIIYFMLWGLYISKRRVGHKNYL